MRSGVRVYVRVTAKGCAQVSTQPVADKRRCSSVCVQTNVAVCLCVCNCVRMCIYVYTCTYVYIRIYVYTLFVCVCAIVRAQRVSVFAIVCAVCALRVSLCVRLCARSACLCVCYCVRLRVSVCAMVCGPGRNPLGTCGSFPRARARSAHPHRPPPTRLLPRPPRHISKHKNVQY